MKKIILVITVILGILPGVAETVSQKQAQKLAHLFFNEAAGRVTAPPKLVYNGRKLTTGRLFTPFYVYNTSLGGFVIISAENKAFPILGFSLKDSFNPEILGETEIEVLTSYATEIELVRYEGTESEQAFRCWQNYPEYVHDILSARYIATDPKFSIEESANMLDYAIWNDNAIYSDLYTPEQWRYMIDEELQNKESVALGFMGKNRLFPAIVYGRQGEYFRIEMSERNSWLMRLNATEVISGSMIAVNGSSIIPEEDYLEEIPFAEHNEFIVEANEIEENRRSLPSIDIPIMDSKPSLKALGGGHYEIYLPEEAVESRIFNIAGSQVGWNKFRNTNVVNVDLSAEPSGFYFISILGESGTPYGLKLIR